ncbi:ABC transporter permease [Anianabacter salinae]|uniref:ABC transporter permease n=1 Tax=Anianabacter salinae TaxID=2851023 RepID=UPI00225DDA50|nr:ABC transporter permease [Anianabacter salinae]MBV0912386.1 ABC transporter permease [Anianabacter salinae]
MIRAGLSALLSHWLRRPFQLVTLVTGLALATALWSGVQAINAEARASYDQAAETLGEARYPQIVPDGADFPQADYVGLRRAGWPVTPVIEGRLRAGGQSVRLIGIDPLTAPADIAPDTVEVETDLAGFITPPGLLYANPETAPALSGLGLRVVPAASVAPGTAIGDIGIVQGLLGQPGRLTRLILTGDAPGTPLQDIASGLTRRAQAESNDIARLTDSFHLNLTAFGLLSFAVGLFIVHGAIGLAFEQRRPVFRTLRALGLPLRTLIGLLSLELVILALVSGGIGMALGYLIAAALLPDVAATLRGLYGADVSGQLSLRPAWWAAGMVIALLGTAIAAAGAFWRVARLPLLASAQPRAWSRGSAAGRLAQGAAAAALGLVALGLALVGSGLVAGFVLLGVLLIAAALALPLVLHGVLVLAAGAARGALPQWFWADTRQQLPGLSLALMALLLALAANIGVGTMVQSFRATFTGWLDQRLAAELYVRASDPAEAERLLAYLDGRVDAVLPIVSVDAVVMGAPAEIFGVADHATYRDNWPLLSALPDVWDRVARGEAVLVNEQLARREALAPGDPLPLPGGDTRTIGGVYSDYGNPLAQVLIGLDAFRARYPDAPELNFGLRLPAPDAPALQRALTDEAGIAPDQITDQQSLKRFSLGIFERTFAVTGALNVLTLAVAGFAILTSLLTLSTMRQPQLAPVWALGLTRASLARLEILRALFLALVTFIAAIPVGLLLAYVLLAVINVEAFGWRLPMQVFPGDWLWLGALSMLAALLAALWPARRLARTPPAELLKVFANER